MKGFIVAISYSDFLEFVRARHAGQISMNGEPYIEHLLRVAERTRELLDTLPKGMLSSDEVAEAMVTALGHDLFEDEKAMASDVLALGGSERLIGHLDALSRVDPKPVYQEWIKQIATADDLVPLVVKLADNLDNNSDDRINALPVEKRSIRKRYDRAYKVLKQALDDRVSAYNLAAAPTMK